MPPFLDSIDNWFYCTVGALHIQIWLYSQHNHATGPANLWPPILTAKQAQSIWQKYTMLSSWQKTKQENKTKQKTKQNKRKQNKRKERKEKEKKGKKIMKERKKEKKAKQKEREELL